MGVTASGIVYPDPSDVPRRQDLQDLATTAEAAISTLPRPFASRGLMANQALPISTFTEVLWTNEVDPPVGITYSAGKFTVGLAGRYFFMCAARISGTGGNRRIVRALRNGQELGRVEAAPALATGTTAPVASVIKCVSGDALSFEAWQDSAAAQNITAQSSLVTITWMGG